MLDQALRCCQLALIAISIVVLPLSVGCTPSVDAITPEVVDPTEADQVAESAVNKYREALAGNSPFVESELSWPQLFGANRRSAVEDRQLNIVWPDSGPPECWSIPCGSGYGSPVTAAGKVVFNHRIDDDECVQCVSAMTGETLWEHRYPTDFHCDFEYSSGPHSTPVIHGDYVYAVGGQGQFFCLQLETGRQVWSRDFHQEFGLGDDLFAVGSSPLVIDDKLIFNVGAVKQKAGVIALDRHSGETIWTATDHGAAYCSPFYAQIHDQPFVFVITQIGLVSLDPHNGNVDWMIEHHSRSPMSFNSVSPLVDGDKVLAVTGPGPGAVCIQVQPDRGYEEVWRDRRVIDSQYNTLMLADGLVYGFTSLGVGGAELRCVEMATGKLRWKYPSILRRGQGLIVGDGIIAIGEHGHLAAILRTEDEPQVLAFTAQPLMQSPCYCSPAIGGGQLYLKDESRLACFDLSVQEPTH